MPDFLQLVSLLREQMSATLSRSDVLRPLAWLVLILAFAFVGAAYSSQSSGIVGWAFAALLGGAVLYGFAYVYCLLADRDALRSEKYSLQKMAIEHGFLGDSSVGIFKADEMLPQETLGTDAVATKQIEHKP